MIAALCAALFLGLQLPTAEPSASTTTPVAQPGAESRRILVVPFETPGRDGRTYWLGEGVALLLADDINARGLGAITRTVRERAYEQLHLPASAVLSRATVIKVGEIVGAAQVIVGEVTLEGDALSVHARSIRIDVGRADAEIVERGSLSDLFAVARRVARRAAPGGSEAAATTTPLPQAFEQFVRGVVAEQPATRASFLEAALKLEPGYDRARIELWQARMDQAEYAKALAAVREVAADSPYGRRARFLSGVSLMALQKYDEAFALYKDLQAAAPAATILNNLGVVQLRRTAPAEEGKPVYFFTEAAKAAPNDPDVLFNLGYAYALDRDPQGAIYSAIPPMPTRISCSRPHSTARGAPPRPAASASSPRSWPPVTPIPRAAAIRCRKDSRGSSRTSTRGARRGSTRRSPVRPSAINASWSSSMSSAASACSTPSRTAKPSASCAARSSCRPTMLTRTCCSAASTCGAAVRATRSRHWRFRCGAAKRRRHTSRLPTRSCA